MHETSIETLIDDLAATDFNLRARSLAQLVELGREVVPALRDAFENSGLEVRVLVLRSLYEIADPDCAELFRRALDDSDERVRAYAALGLTRLGDPVAVDALVRTIDDFPEVLRQPSTPSTDALVAMGSPALAKVVPLLSSDQPMTRVRAFLVIRNIVSTGLQDEGWETLWARLGAYDPQAADSERQCAAQQWRDWIEQYHSGE